MEQANSEPVGVKELQIELMKARGAWYDVANPPDDQVQIPIQGINETLTGEYGLRTLPFGTVLCVRGECREWPQLYMRIRGNTDRQWVDVYGRTRTHLEVFTDIVSESAWGSTITTLAYGALTIEELQAKP